MIDYHKVKKLKALREAAGLTQTEAAKYFDLDAKGRDTVRAWEYGYNAPVEDKRRSKFIAYLWNTLGLRDNPEEFLPIWNEIMVGEWRWQELTDEELKRLPGLKKPASLPTEPLLITEGGQSISANAILDACKIQVGRYLKAEQTKYDPALYVNRVAIEAKLNEFLQTPNSDSSPYCFLVVAPAGSGKTNLLCHLAQSRATEARQPTLLLLGRNLVLDNTTRLWGVVQAELEAAANFTFRSAGECLYTLQRLTEEKKGNALIMLDAINEYPNPDRMIRALEDLLLTTRGKPLKLVITCRDLYWGQFEKEDFWQGVTLNLPAETDEVEATQLPPENFNLFTEVEFKQAWPLYKDRKKISGELTEAAAEKCRQPLLLRFFCEAYAGQEVGDVEDIRLKELFDLYWVKKLETIAKFMNRQGSRWSPEETAEALGGYLQNLAAYMLLNNVQAISREALAQATRREEEYRSLDSFYGRIRNEHIILEEVEPGQARQPKARQVKFVYEEFMEYVMARALIAEWEQKGLDEAGILAEIEGLIAKYGHFAKIMGVMIYLALILKEPPRNLALWKLLLTQGKAWQKVVFEAIRKLPPQQLDTGVFEVLNEILDSGDEDIQLQVLDILKMERVGRVAPRSTVEKLLELVGSEQESIGRRAVLALGYGLVKSAAPEKIQVIIQALNHPKPGVQENATRVLVKLGIDPIPWLIGLLLDTNLSVKRKNAINTLGRLGDKRAVEPLIGLLKDANWRMRGTVTRALGRLGDERAVEPLIAALKDEHKRMRWAAAEALGQLGDERAVEPLIAALKDEDEKVQWAAAKALGQLGDKRAFEPLITVLREDKYRRARWAAAEALGQLGDERAVELLVTTLNDSDYMVQDGAIWALGRLGNIRAVEPLIGILRDENHSSQWDVVIEALVQLGDKRAIEPLIAILKMPYYDFLWPDVAEALEKLGEGSAELLEELAQRKSVWILQVKVTLRKFAGWFQVKLRG